MSQSPEYAENYREQTGEESHTLPAVDVRVVAPVNVEEFPPRMIVTDQAPVSPVAARIAGAHRTRASLTIAPHGADIYIGASPMVTAGTGFLIADGGSLTIEATAEVWAITDAGAAGTVHVLAQVREG